MRILPLITVVLVSACNRDIYVRDGVTDGDTFYVAPQAYVDTDPVLQSWVAYSLSKSVCQLEMSGDNPARQSSYHCEFKSRNILIDAWVERRANNPELSDDYLDDMLRVREAGYVDEYTVYFFARDNWQVPVEVDVDGFSRWRRDNLRGHRPQTRIIGSWGYRPEPGPDAPMPD